MYRPAIGSSHAQTTSQNQGGGVNRKDSVRIDSRVMATSGLKLPNITHVIRDISPHKRESRISPHGTPKPQKTAAPDNKKFAQGSPQPGKSMVSPGTPSPLWVGIRNSALTPHTKPWLEDTTFTVPQRTHKP